MTQTMICLLMIDAGYVAYLQIRRKNPWPFICAYWALLTVKNLIDFVRCVE